MRTTSLGGQCRGGLPHTYGHPAPLLTGLRTLRRRWGDSWTVLAVQVAALLRHFRSSLSGDRAIRGPSETVGGTSPWIRQAPTDQHCGDNVPGKSPPRARRERCSVRATAGEPAGHGPQHLRDGGTAASPTARPIRRMVDLRLPVYQRRRQHTDPGPQDWRRAPPTSQAVGPPPLVGRGLRWSLSSPFLGTEARIDPSHPAQQSGTSDRRTGYCGAAEKV